MKTKKDAVKLLESLRDDFRQRDELTEEQKTLLAEIEDALADSSSTYNRIMELVGKAFLAFRLARFFKEVVTKLFG